MRATVRLSTTVDSYVDLIINVHAQAGRGRVHYSPLINVTVRVWYVNGCHVSPRMKRPPCCCGGSWPICPQRCVLLCRPKRKRGPKVPAHVSNASSPLVTGQLLYVEEGWVGEESQVRQKTTPTRELLQWRSPLVEGTPGRRAVEASNSSCRLLLSSDKAREKERAQGKKFQMTLRLDGAVA